jgi:hypothetical protein
MIISERYTIERIYQLIKLLFPFTLGFVCMLLFEGYKITVARIKTNQWIVARKNAVLPCGPGQLLTGANYHVDDTDPQNKRNGNNCTHQQGANSLCETVSSRRRTIKFMPVEEK